MKTATLENNSLAVIETDEKGNSTRWTISDSNIRQHMPMFEAEIAKQLNRVEREEIAFICAKDVSEKMAEAFAVALDVAPSIEAVKI